ncbi:MAG: DNA repair protein RadC [Patescibacteria group bacterium]
MSPNNSIEKQSFTIRDLPQSERPRERLQKFGPEALSAQELLALILGRGTAGEPVMMTAQKLLSHFGSLEGIMQASLEDLQSIKGIGLAKASQMKACMEVVKRQGQAQESLRGKKIQKRKVIISPRSLYELVRPKIRGYAKEHFLVLSFDTRNKLLGIDTISIGTLNASLVHPRETFDIAIRRHAAHIIVAHNHPSDDTDPSEDDLEITKRLAQAGKILGIELIDHVIISQIGFLSFKEKGLL